MRGHNLVKNIRDYFFRGIAALLPTILTIWLFVQCYKFVQTNISLEINRGIVRILVLSTESYPYPTDEEIRLYAVSKDESLRMDEKALGEAVLEKKYIDGARINKAEKYWVYGGGQIAGFLAAILGVIFFGALLASVLGRAIWRRLERFLLALPLIKKVYPYIKQITDFFLTQNKLQFTRVAAVQYPRQGIWTIALVTGESLKSLAKQSPDRKLVTLFIPSSPTPFTGYVITVPADEIVSVDMTIEEALRFIISGGVITPSQQKKYEESKSTQDIKG